MTRNAAAGQGKFIAAQGTVMSPDLPPPVLQADLFDPAKTAASPDAAADARATAPNLMPLASDRTHAIIIDLGPAGPAPDRPTLRDLPESRTGADLRALDPVVNGSSGGTEPFGDDGTRSNCGSTGRRAARRS